MYNHVILFRCIIARVVLSLAFARSRKLPPQRLFPSEHVGSVGRLPLRRPVSVPFCRNKPGRPRFPDLCQRQNSVERLSREPQNWTSTCCTTLELKRFLPSAGKPGLSVVTLCRCSLSASAVFPNLLNGCLLYASGLQFWIRQ
jgi:hypothetical protein